MCIIEEMLLLGEQMSSKIFENEKEFLLNYKYIR